MLNQLERTLENGLDRVWARFRNRPVAGAVLAGGAALTVATLVGATELALAVGIGYAAYKAVLKRRLPPGQAIREAMRLQKKLAG